RVGPNAAARAGIRLAVQVAAGPEAAAAGKSAPASRARAPAATVGQERDKLRPATPLRRAEATPKGPRLSALARRIEELYTAAVVCVILGFGIFVTTVVVVQGRPSPGARGIV